MTVSPFPAPSAVTLTAFRAHAQQIIDLTVQRSLVYTDEVQQHGEDAGTFLRIGLRFTTDMLIMLMEIQAEELVDDQLMWALKRLPHDGVLPEHVLHRFELYRDVVEEVLPEPHQSEVAAVVTWLIEKQRSMMSGIDHSGT